MQLFHSVPAQSRVEILALREPRVDFSSGFHGDEKRHAVRAAVSGLIRRPVGIGNVLVATDVRLAQFLSLVMMAAVIVEEGRVRAAKAKRSTEFAQALRRLANPRLETEAFLANAKVALEAMGGTVSTRDLFDGLPRFEGLVFIRALKFCLAGDLSDRAVVCRIARAIWRRVAVSRGPKLTHASAAHEYFLESQSIFETAAFTWSPEEEDFTDRLTQATREEFDDPDFNPVPARRRFRAKQR